MLPFEKVKREILVKKKAETNPKYGLAPEKRSIKDLLNMGIVNIDKPSGPTSHECSEFVQKILNIKKSGHSGTLDPKVTGVLPTALGRGTRIVQTLLTAGKEYIAVMHLHKEVPGGKLKSVLKEFTGKIKQKPPIKSAVKRQLRERTIYYLDMLDMDGQDVLLKIGCEAGTYIRKLLHDIGQKLGVGAHMAELRRTKAAGFTEEDNLTTLHDLKDAYWYWHVQGNEKFLRHCIQPVENAVSHLPKIWVLDATINAISHGRNIAVPGISKLHSGIKHGETVAVMTLKGEIACLGTAKMSSKEMMDKAKGIAIKTDKVFILPEVYPRLQ